MESWELDYHKSGLISAKLCKRTLHATGAHGGRLQGCTEQPRLRPRESGLTLFQVNMQSNKAEIHD